MAVYPGLHSGIPIHEAGRGASRREIAPFRLPHQGLLRSL